MTENNSPGGWNGQPQQPPYGQPDPTYAQNPYGQGSYNRGPYNQGPYNQSPYGQVPYGSIGRQGEPTLGQPHYGIGFVAAVKRGFAKYARFDGRASRSEFWWWQLAVNGALTILFFIAIVVALATSPDGGDHPGAASIPLFIVVLVAALAVTVPTIAITVRRLHDTNVSGWFSLLNLVTGVIVLILCIQDSDPQGARYDRPEALG